MIRKKIRRSFVQAVIACTAGTVLFALLGSLLFNHNKHRIRSEEQKEISLLASIKLKDVINWRQERLSVAAVVQDNPFLLRGIRQVRQGGAPAPVREELMSYLSKVKRSFRFEEIFLTDPEGNILAASGRTAEPLAQAEAGVRAAAKGSKPFFSEPFRNAISGDLELDLYVPLRPGDDGKAFAVAVLRSDPESALFPLLSLGQEDRRTVKAMLMLKKGSEVRVLVGEEKGAFLSPYVCLRDGACLRLIQQGSEGQVECRDARGVPVLEDVRPVPGSDWFLVTKVDQSEAYKDMRAEGSLIASSVVLLSMISWLAVVLFWYRQRARFYRGQYEAETALRDLRQRYDYLMKQANDAILVLDEGLRVVDVNDRACALYGYGREELIGLDARELRPPRQRAEMEAALGSLGGGKGKIYETVHLRRDGTDFPVEASVRVIEVAGKKYYQGIIRDISERKAAEEELVKNEYQYRLLFESAGLPIYYLDKDGIVLMTNAVGAAIFGDTSGALVGKTVRDVLTEEAAAYSVKVIKEAVTSGRERAYQSSIVISGVKRWFNVFLRPVWENDGSIASVLVVAHDITDLKNTEESLRESEQQKKAILDNMPDVAWLKDREGRYIAVNDAFARACGRPPGEVVGRTDGDVWPPELARKYRADDDEVMRAGQRKYFEEVIQAVRGKASWVETAKTPLFNTRNEAIGTAGIARDITERRKNLEALHESEERYRKLVELSPDAIAIQSDGKINFVNPSALRLLGAASFDDLKDLSVLEIVHPEHRKAVEERLASLLEEERVSLPAEERFMRLDGQVIDVEMSAIPFNYDGKKAVQLIFRDIGIRKTALRELAQSEERYRALVENAKDVIFRFSTEGRVTFFNPAFEVLSGMKREEATGKHFAEFVHPDDLPLVRANFERTMRGENKPPYEVRVRGKNSEYLIGEIKSVPIIVNGVATGIQGIMTDVTGRNKMEANLKEAGEYLNKIINAVADPLFVKDEQHRLILVNDAECALIGRPREEILGNTDYAFFPREQVDVFWETDRQVFATGEENVNEEKIRDAAGRERTFLTRKTLYNGMRGRCIVGITRDITEYKEAERRLELNFRKENVINLLLHISLDNVHTKDILAKVLDIVRSNTWLGLEPKGAIFLMNRDFSEIETKVLRGYDDVCGHRCERIDGHASIVVRAALQREAVFSAKDGRCCRGSGSCCNYCLPLKYDGRVRGAMALHFREGHVPSPGEETFLRVLADVVSSILQRKQAEKEREEYRAQMVQTSKLTAIGQMAAGVAHELNNPLTVITVNTQYLAGGRAGQDEVPSILEDMNAAAQRCKKIIANLLEFSRKKDLEFEECRVEDLLERSLHLSEFQVKAQKVCIEKSFAAGLPAIRASSSHLVQVFVNVISNAFQAMRDGGRLSIAAAPAAGRPFIEVSFTDTGEGIPPSSLERIFEPFYTTKSSGTGLGLAVSYGLVKQHGGDIRVQSPGPGQGTTFTISLPLQQEQGV